MAISKDEVKHVAHMARLKLSEAEVEIFTGQLNDILNYARHLGQLDTDDVEPMAHVLPVQNVWRQDKVGSSLPREKALSNAPLAEQGFFKVPKVIE